jgi:Ig-like domain from next to BRCA1 gene
VQMSALGTTAPGGTKAVSFSFTAPSTSGIYKYRIQPLENGLEWFGSEVILTLNVGGVGPQVNGLTYGSTTFNATATTNSSVNFIYNVTNSGTKTWAANHFLALRQFNYAMVQMGSLGTTAPGGTKAVSYSFTAPSTPGTYQYRVQPLENGVEWFGSEVILTLQVVSGLAAAPPSAISVASDPASNRDNRPDGQDLITMSADFNSDGQPDMLWQDLTTGECGIHLMQDGRVSASISLGEMPLEWKIVGVTDYDGDGQMDVLWQNTVTNECSVWLMLGTHIDSVVSLSAPPDRWPTLN